MLIFDNNSHPIILSDIYTPTVTDHIWTLDLTMMDFTLSPLLVLEEIIAPTIELMVGGFTFKLPANWNMLIVDEETSALDVVEIGDISGGRFTAFVYGPEMSRHEASTVTVMDYFPSFHNVGPSLAKHQMLCHPISPNTWVNIAPSDSYNKYLKERIVGDLV